LRNDKEANLKERVNLKKSLIKSRIAFKIRELQSKTAIASLLVIIPIAATLMN
jgi:hypothetical protein